MPINPNIPRAMVEHLVREQVYAKLHLPLPPSAQAPNGLVGNESARHCHLSPQAVEQLFGRDYALTPMKELYQGGAYAAKETVTLVGPRSRVISNLRILGPCRDFNQIELAYTDAIALGFQVPLRLSGDIEGTPGCMLMGPKGFFEMPQGVIRAAPHVHMAPHDASYYGVQHKDVMKMKVHGDCPVTFDNIVARVDESCKLEVKKENEEGEGGGVKPDTYCELIKRAAK
jgi:putative phosphotransacetylase